jgi:hypothetical protein
VTRFDMLVNRFKALGRSLNESDIMTQFALKASVSAAETVVRVRRIKWDLRIMAQAGTLAKPDYA